MEHGFYAARLIALVEIVRVVSRITQVDQHNHFGSAWQPEMTKYHENCTKTVRGSVPGFLCYLSLCRQTIHSQADKLR